MCLTSDHHAQFIGLYLVPAVNNSQMEAVHQKGMRKTHRNNGLASPMSLNSARRVWLIPSRLHSSSFCLFSRLYVIIIMHETQNLCQMPQIHFPCSKSQMTTYDMIKHPITVPWPGWNRGLSTVRYMKLEQIPPRLPTPIVIASATPRLMSPPADPPAQASTTAMEGNTPLAAMIVPPYEICEEAAWHAPKLNVTTEGKERKEYLRTTRLLQVCPIQNRISDDPHYRRETNEWPATLVLV